MKRNFELMLAIAFLLYGLIRLGVGTLLFGQNTGLIDVAAFRDPIVDIAKFLHNAESKQLVPVSVSLYVSYIAVMGAVLTTGAIKTMRNRRLGLGLIGFFLVMYALLFINFQTINPKIIHLCVCFILFIILVWLKGGLSGMRKSVEGDNPQNHSLRS